MCLAVPGRVVSIYEEDPPEMRRGKVDFAGVQKEICLAYTPEAKLGDYVIVHVGFALNVVDEIEAHKIFEALRELGELEEAQDGTDDRAVPPASLDPPGGTDD
ncbi:MAG: HypC/HybG/HupF family hydrogenase formation chaperone [Bryobacterales bacterium]|nr:HypC/HybG/HupF family hydrogenase formation chaperone [Bryobacterales bacterium]